MTTRPPRKPAWLKVRFPAGPNYARIDRLHREQGLHSVCRSAACPNQGECWEQGTATFMILGDHCTRDCRFCNVTHETPLAVDPQEADKVAKAIAELKLNHAVITSVTRDDLEDGGAAQFAAVTRARTFPGAASAAGPLIYVRSTRRPTLAVWVRIVMEIKQELKVQVILVSTQCTRLNVYANTPG